MEVNEFYQLNFTQNNVHCKFFLEYKPDLSFTLSNILSIN